MDEFLKLLEANLKYIYHKIIDDTIYINAEPETVDVKCPYCGHLSTRVHSCYERSFQDLPIQGKKVIILLNRVCPTTKKP